MVGLDRGLSITCLNPRALSGIGRPASELIGRHGFDVFPDLASRIAD